MHVVSQSTFISTPWNRLLGNVKVFSIAVELKAPYDKLMKYFRLIGMPTNAAYDVGSPHTQRIGIPTVKNLSWTCQGLDQPTTYDTRKLY